MTTTTPMGFSTSRDLIWLLSLGLMRETRCLAQDLDVISYNAAISYIEASIAHLEGSASATRRQLLAVARCQSILRPRALPRAAPSRPSSPQYVLGPSGGGKTNIDQQRAEDWIADYDVEALFDLFTLRSGRSGTGGGAGSQLASLRTLWIRQCPCWCTFSAFWL